MKTIAERAKEMLEYMNSITDEPREIVYDGYHTGYFASKAGVSYKTIQRIRDKTAWKDIASQYNVFYGEKPQVIPLSESTTRIKELMAKGLRPNEIVNVIISEYPDLTKKKVYDRVDYMIHREERIPKMKKHKEAYKARQKARKLEEVKVA